MRLLLFYVVLMPLLLSMLQIPTMLFSGQVYALQATEQAQPQAGKTYTSQDCVGCHQTQTDDWHMSDHAKAMALPNNTTVLANFAQQYARHYSQLAYFFTENGQFKATIKDNADANDNNIDGGETFTIKYTFGHYPLQQYLVETELGRLQVLPFAWDARTKEEGGQRWYHIYTEDIRAEDRLHWRQPLQNWNGMCADCHSDELKRNYQQDTNKFKTTFSGINVGCVSCHGTKDNEIHALAVNDKPATSGLNEQGLWKLEPGNKTVSWSGPARDNTFMDGCFACHSLRSPLTDGFAANTQFLDNFSPQLIIPPLYHADGQIKEEVYVYGSFLQSKMYEKGVNCLDCHDPHTMKIKTEGNGLCLQCHTAQSFDTPKHHKHPVNTAGAQCVNCHMPSETYMGVDDRRDHSFKIPRPDLSDSFDTRNACIACHKDESNQWAASALEKWNGAPKVLSQTRHDLLKLRHGQGISLQAHLLIGHDSSIDTITRASAIEMLNRSTDHLLPTQLTSFVNHEEALIRLAAARVANLVPAQERASMLQPLLNDAVRAVRTAAVQQLVSLDIAKADINIYAAAFKEMLTANENVAWRGEGRVNQGNIALQEGDQIGAEIAYKGAVNIDPYFPVGYMNLADFYRAKQREDLVSEVLKKGLENLPLSADIAYSYGLHMVRQKSLPQAIQYFSKSVSLDPANPQLAYTYALAIDGTGDTRAAIKALKKLMPNYQNKQQLVELGLYLAQKAGSRSDFDWFQQQR